METVVRPSPVVATLFLLHIQIVQFVVPVAAQGAAAAEAIRARHRLDARRSVWALGV
jgi:hypothetical protein